MKRFCNLFYLFIFLSTKTILAQGEAAVPFLYLNPSPQLTGLGWTGVSFPNNDAFGFHYNPAMIGYFGQSNNLSMQMYPGSVDWLNFNQMDYNSFAFNIGYNFKNELDGLKLSAGAGFIRNRINFGNFFNPPASNESYDLYNAYALGASIDYYITFAMGITFKDIYSQIGTSPSGQQAKMNANAIDYGFLLILPVLDLFDNANFELSDSRLIPVFNYSLGYSRLNIGDEVYYIDPSQIDPLPLTARLGHTLSFGMNFETDNLLMNMLQYDLILEADDILVSRDFDPQTFLPGEIKYDGMFGEIDFVDNLIKLKTNDDVVVHKGHSIKFVETVTILKGSFSGRGYSRGVKTNGLIVSSSGFFKWLASISEDSILMFIADHFELKYINSTIFEDEVTETDFSSLSVSFFNFSLN